MYWPSSSFEEWRKDWDALSPLLHCWLCLVYCSEEVGQRGSIASEFCLRLVSGGGECVPARSGMLPVQRLVVLQTTAVNTAVPHHSPLTHHGSEARLFHKR